jgi:hypothetical protein
MASTNCLNNRKAHAQHDHLTSRAYLIGPALCHVHIVCLLATALTCSFPGSRLQSIPVMNVLDRSDSIAQATALGAAAFVFPLITTTPTKG